MSDAAVMLRELSEPWSSGERVKSVLQRTSRLAKLSYWRTFDIWYRKARQVEDYEVDQIRDALRIKNEKAARNELHELQTRLAVLEARLNAGDSDFHSPASAQDRQEPRHGRHVDRAVDSRLKL
jgi:hypothetical protein